MCVLLRAPNMTQFLVVALTLESQSGARRRHIQRHYVCAVYTRLWLTHTQKKARAIVERGKICISVLVEREKFLKKKFFFLKFLNNK